MLQSKSVGQVLFDSVVQKLQLLESDYFGLQYFNDDLMPVSQSHYVFIGSVDSGVESGSLLLVLF